MRFRSIITNRKSLICDWKVLKGGTSNFKIILKYIRRVMKEFNRAQGFLILWLWFILNCPSE